MKKDKVKIGIFELTGCAGDGLLILDCERELLDIFKAVDIQYFAMAKSDNIGCQVDIALVEGSVSTEKDIDEVKRIRTSADILAAIGLCATFGGIQNRFGTKSEWKKNYSVVYGQQKMIHTLPVQSKPLDAYVDVDYYLPGCPIGKKQFLSFFTRIMKGNPPEHYPRPVCVSCKSNENDCLLNGGEICLGPLTADGCGAVCINHNLPCIGCWGPVEGSNPVSQYSLLREKGFGPDFIQKKMANFSGKTFDEVFTSRSKEHP